MKNGILILITALLFNCTSDDANPKNENEELLGKWKLIEQLADPGDGSGTFNPIDSARIIEFFSNGTVTVNGLLCYMSSEVDSQKSGTFSEIESAYYDGEIVPTGCDYSETKIYYVIEDSNLILWYLCIEGCGQKFEKVD